MQERYLGRIQPDMEVSDINGDKVGTVSRVYRYEAAASDAVDTSATLPGDEIVEVKTGLFGLGTHYYIPMSAIADATQSCVFISKPKDDFQSLGWHEKPAHLDELH